MNDAAPSAQRYGGAVGQQDRAETRLGNTDSMLDFAAFGPDSCPVAAGTRLRRDVALVWDTSAAMQVTVRKAARATDGAPTLIIRGEDRAPDDWFALELDLTPHTRRVALTARNYPAHRLFPRIHYDLPSGTRHLDLPDVAASDAFATRHFDARLWQQALDAAPTALRLTILIPSTPWFAMEIASIAVFAAEPSETADA